MKNKVVYFGFNSFLLHKRGVENVIDFQSSCLDDYAYYLHWGTKLSVYKYKRLVCISLPHNSCWKFIILSLIVRKLFRRNRGNIIIHSHNSLMTIFLYRQTDLFTVHDGLYYQKSSESDLSFQKKISFYLLEKILYLRCKWIHFISDYAKLQSLFPVKKENYTKIYNSSNYEEMAYDYVPNVLHFLERFPFLSIGKYCFIVRSIEERARIDLIISVAENEPTEKFVIAGKGPLLESYRNEIKQRGIKNVFLLGFISDEDLFLLYSYSKLIIVPAEYGEGFGLPIIEGYLFNKSVIASNRCAIPEVIINRNFLFENSVDSIRSTIKYSSEHINTPFNAYYQSRFSHSIIKSEYCRLYEKLFLNKSFK